ncbi:MAG: DUF92 domain-containing protein [Methanomassiliicoccaceae archaeon]|nr:DUF92 domain-containing protein [Methanomassiliicoccaceae archaeon]
MELLELIIIIVMAGLLSILAQYLGLLTFDGAVASLGVGLVIGLFGSTEWLLILIIFATLGFAATMIGLTRKKARGLQEGLYGERMYKNILAVGLVPCIFAIIYFLTGDHYELMTIGYIASIAVAAADTIASEIGVKDKRVWMITTFKRTEPGTDGGVSLFGTAVALAAATATTAIGWVLMFGLTFDVLFFVPVIAGMVGCFADSFLGATIESRGYISKYANNAITAGVGAVFAIVVYVLMF